MTIQRALVAAVAVLGIVAAEYSAERSRPSYVTPSPDTPYQPEPAESKRYADEDRPRYDGPSHGRTGPHTASHPSS